MVGSMSPEMGGIIFIGAWLLANSDGPRWFKIAGAIAFFCFIVMGRVLEKLGL